MHMVAAVTEWDGRGGLPTTTPTTTATTTVLNRNRHLHLHPDDRHRNEC